jgi:prepilin-type N-terminal cleavage/methylation domain-containing protein
MKRRNSNGFTLVEMLVTISILLIIVVLVVTGGHFNSAGFTVPDADFNRLMAQEGVHNPVKGTYTFGACPSDGDAYSLTFTGIENGVRVNGVICRGYSSAYSIRYSSIIAP